MHIFKNLFFGKRFFVFLASIAVLFVFGYFYASVYAATRLIFIIFFLACLFDMLILFQHKKGISASRKLAEKLSNGDYNPIKINFANNYNFLVNTTIIDEIPFIFQKRDFKLKCILQPGEQKELIYTLRPTKRGSYRFGAINIFVSSTIGLIQRRFEFDQAMEAAVYPSIIQMRKYELYAISNRLTEAGIKKIRRVGHTMEFDQIRNYVRGDDYRTINWKATARRRHIMVNQYQDEKSQHVYAIIDMGRSMKMPFDGMSLLDYAINSSLVISNIAIQKGDKPGIVTFNDQNSTVLPANGQYKHMHKILHMLYKQQTAFLESDYEKMYTTINLRVKQRSLILLFSNFESLIALRRQINILKGINKRHALIMIFFKNSELENYIMTTAQSTEDIYKKTIAEKLLFEKRQIIKELQQSAIQSILVEPHNLTVSVINKYLELKARALI